MIQMATIVRPEDIWDYCVSGFCASSSIMKENVTETVFPVFRPKRSGGTYTVESIRKS
jgi:hypothetical protein